MILQALHSVYHIILKLIPFWIIFRILVYLYGRKQNLQLSFFREFILISFFLYLIVLAAFTIVPLPFSRSKPFGSLELNFVPIINTIKVIMQKNLTRPERAIFFTENILGNLAMFIPLGAFLPLVTEKFKSWRRVVLTGFIISVCIEAIQYISISYGIYRTVDIDDVILNTLGTCAGYLCYLLFKRIKLSKASEKI